MGISRRGKIGLFQHFRRVPKRYQAIDNRELVRMALHTTDGKIAQIKAAEIEALQDARWEALLTGRSGEAKQYYEKPRIIAELRGLAYLQVGRDLKTKYSKREIPMMGVSLEAMRRHPAGFPRYQGKATTWSNTVTKYLRENELLESDEHSAYSLRHALSDRLQNAGCEDRTRKEILGHRPEGVIYGTGASLEIKAQWLSNVAF